MFLIEILDIKGRVSKLPLAQKNQFLFNKNEMYRNAVSLVSVIGRFAILIEYFVD